MSQNDAILEELIALEPIFHTPAFGLSKADREKRMAPDYWEIGAGGRPYTRDFVLTVDPSHFVDAKTAGWIASNQAVKQLGPETYLFTYTLRQGSRVSRRSTVWEKSDAGWIILFHQGTLVAT